MRRGTGWLVVAAVCFALAVPSAGWAQNEIRVGIPISLTGKYDVLGTRNLQGVRLWAEWANKQGGVKVGGKKVPVKVIWYDTKSDKDTTAKLTEKLIVSDKVHFIMGPYGSGLTLAATAITERFGMLMFSHSGASDKIWAQGYKYVIGVLTPATYYYKSTMQMLKKLDPPVNTIALITEDNAFSQAMRRGIKRWAKELGFKIVADDVYPAPPSDLSPIISKVKRRRPDAILASSHFRDGALLAKQAAELKIGGRFLAIGSAPSTVEWWKTVGAAGAQHNVATSQWEPVNAPDPAKFSNWFGPRMTGKQFNAWFKEHWGKPTDFRGAQAFAAGLVLQWAIEHAGSIDRDKVRAALNEMDIMSFYGRSKIDPKTGIQTGHGMVIAQWQDGKKVVVGPPAIAEAKLAYPRR